MRGQQQQQQQRRGCSFRTLQAARPDSPPVEMWNAALTCRWTPDRSTRLPARQRSAVSDGNELFPKVKCRSQTAHMRMCCVRTRACLWFVQRRSSDGFSLTFSRIPLSFWTDGLPGENVTDVCLIKQSYWPPSASFRTVLCAGEPQ